MAATGRVYNFSPGPAVLPESVLKTVGSEMLNFHGCGMSIMEVSHRTPTWEGVMKKTEDDLRGLLNVPAGYKVLFLEGGATHQFSSVPLNLLGDKASADYFVTGTWSKKAFEEAQRYCKANLIADPKKYNRIPEQSEWAPFNPEAAYVYFCDNETVEGVEFASFPVPPAGVPLVIDMSSNFLSKKIDFTNVGMVYACAQKNFGPAGLTIAIIRDDLLNRKPHPACPLIMQNSIQAKNGSMYNTPNIFAIYVFGLVFEWINKEVCGLPVMETLNKRKASKLYEYIDSTDGYYLNPVNKRDRSQMNVTFIFGPKGPKDVAAAEKAFLAEAAKLGLVTLAGHRSVGGFRASIYNAFPEAGVEKLVEFMKTFAASHQ